jgi:hypothetical protein
MPKDLILSSRIQTRRLLEEGVKNYLKDMDESEGAWRDYFYDSTGTIAIQILTSIAELLLFKLETRSSSSYIHTALDKPSIYLLSIGYNPNRKKHSLGKVRAEIKPYAALPFTIPKGFPLKDTSVPCVIKHNTDVPVSERFITNIEVQQGYWKEVYFTREEEMVDAFYSPGTYPYEIKLMDSEEWQCLVIDENDWTVDQFEVYVDVDGKSCNVIDKVEVLKLDDEQIATVNRTGDLAYVKKSASVILDENFVMSVDPEAVLVRTDYTGGITLMFGDGNTGKLLTPNSVVRVRYLKTLGQEGVIERGASLGTYIVADHMVDFKCTSKVFGGADEDSIEKIRYLASRFFHTQGRGVTKHDYEIIAMSYPGVISAKCQKIGLVHLDILDDILTKCDNIVDNYSSEQVTALTTELSLFRDSLKTDCCTICISALKDNAVTWSKQEIDSFRYYIGNYKMESVNVEFRPPIDYELDIACKCVVKPGADVIAIETLVKAEVRKYCYKLGGTFRATELLDNISDLDGVKRAYLIINNDREYSDITVDCDVFFEPSDIIVSFEVE